MTLVPSDLKSGDRIDLVSREEREPLPRIMGEGEEGNDLMRMSLWSRLRVDIVWLRVGRGSEGESGERKVRKVKV